ncbi:hypothetical protein FQR65_LT17731 [Abscondita terminalis]|nr:hypothetical protein FQR65_LT17731 [Abscondita terminalis]
MLRYRSPLLPDASVADSCRSGQIYQCNLRTKPEHSAEMARQQISDLVYGDMLILNGESGSFYAVTYPDKRKAYVRKEQAMTYDKWLTSRKPTSENIISSAKTMLGLPYLWGDAALIPPTSYTIGIDTEEMIRQKVAEADQFKILKVKLGLDTDKMIIDTIRKVTDAPAMCDVNKGWKSREQALEMVIGGGALWFSWNNLLP